MAVDQTLIDEACKVLDVVVIGTLKPGTQKTVRLAERNGQTVVLKVIEVGSTNAESLQRAVREVDLLQSLDCSNVVKVESDLVELGVPATGAAWLEEYLDGHDLSDVAGELWSWDRVAEMAYQVALGLCAIHTNRVVHRDVSPNNIRCTEGGGFIVMDPGFARHELLPPITVYGHPGTYGFMSPEHLRPLPAGPTAFSDVFSLGSLAWLMMTGQPPIPFRGDSSDYAVRLKAVQIEGSESLVDQLDEPKFDFFRRCLHPQPARRFRDGCEAARYLEALR